MIRNHIFRNGAIHLPPSGGSETVRRVILINSRGLGINSVFCSARCNSAPFASSLYWNGGSLGRIPVTIYKDLGELTLVI